MFDFLKKKIGTWLGKKPEKKEKKKTAKAKSNKDKPKVKNKVKNTVSSKKNQKISTSKQNKEKILPIEKESKTKEEIKDTDVKEEEVEEVKEETAKEEIKEDKKGFFSKLFSKKEDKKIEESKTKEEIKDTDVKTEEIKEELEDEVEEELEDEVEEEVEEELEDEVEEEVEEELEDEVEEEVEEKPNFFSKIFKKITSSELTKEDFDDAFEEFEITLLENNVALEAVDKIRETLSKELIGKQVKKDKAQDEIMAALKSSITSVLQEPPNLIDEIKKYEGEYTIVFFGINGTGKTTSIAKIAHLLKKNNISCVLAAGDTFRAASIEQLRTHAEKLGVPIISSGYGSDPTSVIFEAKKYAKTNNIKVVLADTAGRMYTKENLIKEMEKMIRVNKPQLKIFVGESITGNDAIDQARTFNEAIGIDGIILSKADIDEKAGTILSVSHITKKPIYFLGTGQEYKDLLPFTKKDVLKNLGLED